MFQIAPSVGQSAIAQYVNLKKPGLGEDFRHRQERSTMREKMMQSTGAQVVTRNPETFIKKAATHTPLTLNKSRR